MQLGELRRTIAAVEAGGMVMIDFEDLLEQDLADGTVTKEALAEAYRTAGVE